MARWKLTLEYDGSAFSGWQRQADAPTVQQSIEEATHRFSGETVTIHVAGRTDAGVHARAQVAHVDLQKDTTAKTVRDALNFYLRPNPIVVLNAEAVSEAFHARFNAKARRYRYHIINRTAPLALHHKRAWHIKRPLALQPMQDAASMLLGKHDFSTFRAQYCQAKSPLRTLDQMDITQTDDLFIFETKARSFLYHQVRNMVGTLMMVGGGQWSLDQFRTAFKACDRTQGGPTAPPDGLFFWDVFYDDRAAGTETEDML